MGRREQVTSLFVEFKMAESNLIQFIGAMSTKEDRKAWGTTTVKKPRVNLRCQFNQSEGCAPAQTGRGTTTAAAA